MPVDTHTWPADVAPTLDTHYGDKQGLENQHINSGAGLFVRGAMAVAYGIPGNWIGRAPENGGNAVEPMLELQPCQTSADKHGVASDMQVRRLTPTECERLQGFPDGYTNIPWRGKPESPDGPRYKALGNSMAVPVMHWIGKQIKGAIDASS